MLAELVFDLFAEGGTGFNAKPDANKPLTKSGPEVPEGSASKAMEDPVLTPTQGSTAKPGKNLLCASFLALSPLT